MSPNTNIPTCESARELYSALASIDITVPLLSEGRTTRHVERWAICNLVSSLASTGHLSFPVSITHREKPDFLLQTGAGEIGAEVTEALLANFAQYRKLGEKEFPDSFLEPGHFRRGELSVPKMKDLLCQRQFTAPPWMNDSMETEWAQRIADVIEKKLQKLAALDFTKYGQNWLAIHDSLPLPSYSFDKAMEFLIPSIANIWTKTPRFNSIFIEHGSRIACLSDGTLSWLQINDLWGIHAFPRC